MSRSSIETPGRTQTVLRGLNRGMERRISASQPSLCLVEAKQGAGRCLLGDHFGFGRFKGGRDTEW